MPEETGDIRNPDGTFKPGVSGNPQGRPKGTVSIIGRIKQIFEENPEQFEAYVAEVITDPKLRAELIRQIDGAPKQSVDVTSDGKALAVNVIAYGANPDAKGESEGSTAEVSG